MSTSLVAGFVSEISFLSIFGDDICYQLVFLKSPLEGAYTDLFLAMNDQFAMHNGHCFSEAFLSGSSAIDTAMQDSGRLFEELKRWTRFKWDGSDNHNLHGKYRSLLPNDDQELEIQTLVG